LTLFSDVDGIAVLDTCRDLMSEVVYNRCKFVVEEIARTKIAASLLQSNQLTGLGNLLYQSHEGLRVLYQVSCPELDYLVELAKQTPSVLGARMMGGGFGGCTINIVKTADLSDFIASTTTAYAQQFNILPAAYIVSPADGTKRIEEEWLY
jgi:galactokinase